jgi:hypothetical protein
VETLYFAFAKKGNRPSSPSATIDSIGKRESGDLPPLKWSSLKYDFGTEDKINGEEESYG